LPLNLTNLAWCRYISDHFWYPSTTPACLIALPDMIRPSTFRNHTQPLRADGLAAGRLGHRQERGLQFRRHQRLVNDVLYPHWRIRPDRLLPRLDHSGELQDVRVLCLELQRGLAVGAAEPQQRRADA